MHMLQVDVQPVGGPAGRARRWSRRLVVSLVLAALVVVVLLGAGVLPPPPTPEHPNRLVVVDGAGGLFTIASDGSDRVLLRGPDPNAGIQFPAWSPDGTRIAAIGGPSIGSDGLEGAVHVLDAPPAGGPATPRPGSERDRIVYPASRSYPIYVYWSPDGTRIAFLTGETDTLALRVVPADGSSRSEAVRSGQPMYWAWVDGTRLLVHAGGSTPEAFVGEVALDGSVASQVATATGDFQAPAVSGDGTERGYVTQDSQGRDSVVIANRTGAVLASAPIAGASSLAWRPGLPELAYTAPLHDNGLPYGPLEVLDARSGRTRELLDGAVIAWFWSPDGRSVAAIRVVADGGQTASVAPVFAANSAFELDVVDASGGRTRLTLPISLPPSILSDFLPFFDQYALSHRIWSPDSRAVVLPLQDGVGVSHVTVIPVDGSPPVAVADGVAAFWSP
jgi:TolB protein